jgi:hypothetical protein
MIRAARRAQGKGNTIGSETYTGGDRDSDGDSASATESDSAGESDCDSAMASDSDPCNGRNNVSDDDNATECANERSTTKKGLPAVLATSAQ